MAAGARGHGRGPWLGLTLALLLMAVATAVPPLLDWDVHLLDLPPLHAEWDPRFGPGSLAALGLGVLAVAYADRAAQRLSWPVLLLSAFTVAAAWLTALAGVDGLDGIGVVLDDRFEYLDSARQVTDISSTLHGYIERIPLDHPQNWPVHVSSHPPGALLFFVLLVRLGLDTGLEAGLAVLLVAATTPVAVLLTLRRLGAEALARRAAPFLVVGPAAIWMAVSADAVFAAVAAWGLCCLSFAATRHNAARIAGWSSLAGLLLGACLMMSYGLALLTMVALAVLVVSHNYRPLPWAAGAALLVVLIFAWAGFAWWEAYPVLRERYWDGVASGRPSSYWLWGNLAALCFGAGPMVGPSVAVALRGLAHRTSISRTETTCAALTLAGVAMVAIADLSGMSKGEVERIWLPFVPWMLVCCALLSSRWR